MSKNKYLYLAGLFIFLILIILYVRYNVKEGFTSPPLLNSGRIIQPSPLSSNDPPRPPSYPPITDVDSDVMSLFTAYKPHLLTAINTMSDQNNNFPESLTPVLGSINKSIGNIQTAYINILTFMNANNIKNKTYIIPIIIKAASDAIYDKSSEIMKNPTGILSESNF